MDDEMQELKDRLERAVARLEERQEEAKRDWVERTRLGGKIDGVKLALSYLPRKETQ